jgi:CDP-6-deoxy-D-xylo-4-hexulose-3-dehydrase
MARCCGRSSEKYLYGTKVKDSDGRFLEDLDGIAYDGMFIFEDVAYGFIPNEAGAAFGHEQLNKLDVFWKLRDRNFQSHTRFLKKYPDVFLTAKLLEGAETTWICYPVQLRPELGWNRRELQVYLEEAGIFTRVIFSGNITRHPMMRGVDYRAEPGGYPVADRIMEQGLMLPCHPTMTEEDNAYLYQVIEDFIALNRARRTSAA